MASPPTKTYHIAMYPWFAFGHLTPFLHLANKLAKKGHKISYLLPTKTQSKLEQFNLHPDLITFVPVTVPSVEGLPPGAETTSDVPYPLHTHVMTAMDSTEDDIEKLLSHLRPDVVFFDLTHWMPALARRLGVKLVHYCIVSSATIGYSMTPARRLAGATETDLLQRPPGFPDSSIKLHAHEARGHAAKMVTNFGNGISLADRNYIALAQCDALGFRTCREIEGPFIDFLENQFGKPILLTGPVIPEQPTSSLDEKWAIWLSGFKAGSVIYCAFGSECTLKKDQFQELVQGLDLTGMPFFAAIKPPMGVESVEAALPEGFEESVNGRGVVYGEWVQQLLILNHPAVGCFITHCGSGSLAEALVNKCQLVLLPQVGDQVVNARMMSRSLKVGVEVEKGEDGMFTKESVCDAVRTVMDDDGETGRDVRANHAKLREMLLDKDLESSYIDRFNQQLQDLVG